MPSRDGCSGRWALCRGPAPGAAQGSGDPALQPAHGQLSTNFFIPATDQDGQREFEAGGGCQPVAHLQLPGGAAVSSGREERRGQRGSLPKPPAAPPPVTRRTPQRGVASPLGTSRCSNKVIFFGLLSGYRSIRSLVEQHAEQRVPRPDVREVSAPLRCVLCTPHL